MRKLTLLFYIFFISNFLFSQKIEKISLQVDTKSLAKGKLLVTNSEFYFKSIEGKLLIRYLHPKNYISISNAKGELIIHDIKKNEVYKTQNLTYSTETNFIYYFLANKIQTLGLDEMGFMNMKTSFEDGLLVTKWSPPKVMAKDINFIKLVHENFLPIYIEYIDYKLKPIKKVYYSNYSNYKEFNMPQKITEINYIGLDSTINRYEISDIKINKDANSSYFDYEIPKNAKNINPSKK